MFLNFRQQKFIFFSNENWFEIFRTHTNKKISVADYQGKETTEAFMLRDDELIVVAFRGTEFFDAYAWSTDLDDSWYKYVGVGKIHGGLLKALGLTNPTGFPPAGCSWTKCSVFSLLRTLFKDRLLGLVKDNSKAKFIVTGHSLGGALAILFVAILAFYKEDLLLERLRGVYTFGQPRVGDEEFKGFMEKQIDHYKINYQRIVYGNDLVPRIPFDCSTFSYKHFGTCFYTLSLINFHLEWSPLLLYIEFQWFYLMRNMVCTFSCRYMKKSRLSRQTRITLRQRRQYSST